MFVMYVYVAGLYYYLGAERINMTLCDRSNTKIVRFRTM